MTHSSVTTGDGPGQLVAGLSGKPPEVLFHYTSADGLIGIVGSRRLWASSIHYLNDELEFQLALEVLEWSLRVAAEKSHGPRRVLVDAMRDRVESLSGVNVCVFSLSGARDLLSQWRAYCSDGGYCIGFRAEQLHAAAANQGFFLGRCFYEPREQQRLVSSLLDSMLLGYETGHYDHVWADKPIEMMAEMYLAGFIQLAPLLKDKSFEEEREWRLVSDPLVRSEFRFRVGRGGILVPYCEFDPVREEALELPEVLVGPTPHKQAALAALAMFLKNHRVRNWSASHSTTPFRSW